MILVADYDPEWAVRFEMLRALYATALDAAGVPFLGIEHVGSTSVPGLAAKPVIDVDIVVTEAGMAAAGNVLVALGFRPLGDLGIPKRLAFAEPAAYAGTNTYVVAAGSLALRNHLAVREALRADVALREEYGTVKRLVAAGTADMNAYRHGKNAVVQRILAAAGLTDREPATIDGQQFPDRTGTGTD